MANAKAEAFKNSLKVRTAVLLVWKKFPRMSSIRFSSIPGSKQGNVEYPFIVTVDDSVFVTLRVLLDQAVVKGEKRAAVLEEMNRLNHTYKSF